LTKFAVKNSFAIKTIPLNIAIVAIVLALDSVGEAKEDITPDIQKVESRSDKTSKLSENTIETEDGFGDETISDEVGWGTKNSADELDESNKKVMSQKDEIEIEKKSERSLKETETIVSQGEIIGGVDESDAVGFGDLAEDEEVEEDTKSNDLAAKSSWLVSGFSRSDVGFWVERMETNSFAKARQSLDLSFLYKQEWFRLMVSGHGEYDFAYLYKRDTHDAATLDEYEYLVDIRDTYLMGSFKYLDVGIGKQIVVWGQGDTMSLLDVACPRDLREPGLTDLDDMRLPVLSTRLSFFFERQRIDAMVIHEAFFGYRPPPFGDYSPLPKLFSDEIVETLEGIPIWYKDNQNRFSLYNQQYLGRWSYKGPSVDLEVYVASVLDGLGIVDLRYEEILLNIVNGKRAEIRLDHQRYTMIGHSGAWPIDMWIIKWELAADIDRSFNIGDTSAMPVEISADRTSTIGGLIGITYSGFRETVLSLEVKKSWVLTDIQDLLYAIDSPRFALRCYRDFAQESLRLEFFIMVNGWDAKYGWMARAKMEYTIKDGLRLVVGYITYYPGYEFSHFSGMNDNDRFYTQLRWDIGVD
jgi:hypothetical protein